MYESGTGECCGDGEWYDSETQECCNGAVYDKQDGRSNQNTARFEWSGLCLFV